MKPIVHYYWDTKCWGVPHGSHETRGSKALEKAAENAIYIWWEASAMIAGALNRHAASVAQGTTFDPDKTDK